MNSIIYLTNYLFKLKQSVLRNIKIIIKIVMTTNNKNVKKRQKRHDLFLVDEIRTKDFNLEMANQRQ